VFGYRLATALILLTLTIFRACYLLFWAPIDLAPDEAHYWDWARHLDWSYYSKGPLVAWMIRAGLEIFGPLSESLNGTQMPAVRFPSVILSVFTHVGLYVLTKLAFKSERLSFFVILVCVTFPPFHAVSLLSTIDSPYLCCWTWACVFGFLAFVKEKSWAYPLAGLFVCLGILAKYTMALWLFSLGLFLLFTPTHRHILFRSGFWITVAVSALSAVPILYWNSQNDWVSFRHVATQAGVPQAGKNSGIRWLGPLEYVAGQMGLLMGYWFVAWVGGLWLFRPRGSTELSHRYLWWLSVPTFAVFGLSSIKASGQLNWPVSGYMTGFPLGVAWVVRQLEHSNGSYKRLAQVCLGVYAIIGISASVLLHNTSLVYPIVSSQLTPESETNPTPMRSYDPAARLKGWRYTAGEIDKLREEIAQKQGGTLPEIACLRWDMPGQFGVYCKGHPQAYTFGLAFGGRHSQYELWHPNPITDPDHFKGKTFLFVGFGGPKLNEVFGKVDPPITITYREKGYAIATWTVWVCHDFRGFPKEWFQTEGRGY